MAKKIDPDVVDRDGRAALHIAIERKNLTVLDRLLDLGCDPDLVDPARLDGSRSPLPKKTTAAAPWCSGLIVAGAQYKKQLPLNPELMRKPRGP